MSELLKWVLSLSLSGAVLILLLMLVRPLVRERVSKRWQYYIWLLVVLRLLLPVGPPESPAGNAVMRMEDAASVILYAPESGMGDADMMQREENDAPEPAAGPGTLPTIGAAVWENLWAVWLAGALVLLIRKATAYQSFVRCLRAGWEPVENPALLDRVAEIGGEIGVKRPVELYVNPLVASPMLLGSRKPCVVLPTVEMPEEDLRFVLLHELTHYRRRDVLYKWLVQMTICVHWFNPLVHWMGREVERTGELSCDEAVLRRLDGDERRAYGDALLRTVSAGGGYQAVLPSPMLGAEGKQLKERLETIMNFKKTGRLSAVLAALLAAVLGVTAAAAGAYTGLPPVTGAAEKPPYMEETVRRRFTMESFYEAPYMFGIGWNLQKEEGTAVSVPLPDGTKLTVYLDDAAKGLAKDKKAMEALAKVLARLQEETRNTDFPMTRPLVYQWENTGGGSQEEMAEKYYQEGNLPFFKAVFAGLNKPEQASWMTKIYKANNVTFFSAAATGLEADGDLVKAYAETAYRDGAIAQFSILADRMSEETLESWLDRAVRDQKIAFQAMLMQKMELDEDLEALKAELDRKQTEEYQSVGVTADGGDYYYQGKLVNIFLDQRANGSFNTLDMNPKGTVNIRIVRDAEDKITGAAELTQAEVTELFGEDCESVKWDALQEKKTDNWDDDWDWDDDDWDWDWDDEKWDEEEKQRMEEYAALGITQKDKKYYYQGELVAIFLDNRVGSGFYRLEANPEGTCNIKVVRDAEGKVTGVTSIAPEEIERWFGINCKEIPVELNSVESGEYIWLGTYTMEEGDRVYYDVAAEKGEQLSVGFAKAGDKKPRTVYKTITSRRMDGKLEVKSDSMVWESPVEPGEYSLFVYAPAGELAKVSGQVTIIHY